MGISGIAVWMQPRRFALSCFAHREVLLDDVIELDEPAEPRRPFVPSPRPCWLWRGPGTVML